MSDKQRIGILGAGTWGMALARMLANLAEYSSCIFLL